MNEAETRAEPIEPTLHSAGQALFSEIRQLIDQAKQRAAVAINAEITLLYWQVANEFRLKCCKVNALNMADKSSYLYPNS